MKKYNITLTIFSVVFSSLFLTACSEDTMDRINKDINNPVDVDSKFILTDIITRTAFSNSGGDISIYTSTYVEHEVGIHNQLFYAETRSNEVTASTTFNNVWINLYRSLKDARIIIDKCSEGGAQQGNYRTRGMAEIMAAYNTAIITDMFGNAPYEEAARRDAAGLPVYMTPKIDSQESIYKDIHDLLDQAIEDLEKTDEHVSGSVGNNDLLYRGNPDLWIKFAYGLKARYTMRLIHRSANPAQDLENILDYIDQSFETATEQAAFDIYDDSNLNPLFDFQWSRWALAASESLSEKLIERNDPRLRRVFMDEEWTQMTGADDDYFFMAPNGTPQQAQDYYNSSVFVFAQTAPTLLLSYHELLFLKAEALCRLNRAGDAEQVLKDAIVAGIENAEKSIRATMESSVLMQYNGAKETSEPIDQDEAEDYFDNEVKPLFDADPLRETMIQKYLAFFGASGESTETYNDVRRLKAVGENFIQLNNQGKFPLRLPYGTSDTTANPNVKEAYGDGQYVYTENVWWAGGTR